MNELTEEERLLCHQSATLLEALADGERLEDETLWCMTVLLPGIVERLVAVHDQRVEERDALLDLEGQQYLASHPELVEQIKAHDPDLLTEIEVPHEPPADERG